MEDQINNLKKRINDLSILKSSNNAIMNQKLVQLTEENSKLKKNVEMLQSKKGSLTAEEESKPFLFGPEDND
jgi:flagellar biosynthesis chaperone FliJ